MTIITSNNVDIIHHLVKMNAHLISAASDHEIIFSCNLDTTDVENKYKNEIKVQHGYDWPRYRP